MSTDTQLQQGTKGLFGMRLQGAFDTPQPDDTGFHYLAFLGCDFAPAQGVAALPAEAGNAKALPRGTYKTGVFAAGGVDFIPRLESRFGYWLKAAFGDASTSTSQTIDQYIAATGTTAGVNAHLFRMSLTDEFDLPYMTTHKLYPNMTSADEVGEIAQDVRVGSFFLNAPAADIVRARMDLLGRFKGSNVLDIDPSWTTPTLDSNDAFLVSACSGHVQLSVTGGTPSSLTAFDVANARLNVTNGLLAPTQSRKVGSPHPKDYPCLGRNIVFQTVVYVNDYDLYMQLFGGAANPVIDTAWNCDICQGDFDVELASEATIGATTTVYKARYRTTQGNVNWSARPIVLIPNQPVVLALQGVVTASSGVDFEFYIQNDHANYDDY